MNIDIDLGWIFLVILLAIRLFVIFWLTPLDGVGRLPSRIRVFLVLGLSVFMVNALDLSLSTFSVTFWGFLQSAFQEFLLGAVLAFGLYCGVSAFHVGGKLLDFQSGFGAAAIFNPGTNQQDPIWGTLFTIFALLLFFAGDIHLLLIKGAAFIAMKVPPGSGGIELNLDLIVRQFGLMFLWGFAIVAPAVLMLLLIDMAVGIMAKTMPQMNVYFVILPLKIFIAMFMVSVSLGYAVPLVYSLYKAIMSYWEMSIQ